MLQHPTFAVVNMLLGATKSSGSPAVTIVALVIDLILAGLIYRSSEKVKTNTGRSPWGWPSWLWALLSFLVMIVFGILYLIAWATSKDRAPVAQAGYPGAYGSPGAYQPPSGGYGQPYGTPPTAAYGNPYGTPPPAYGAGGPPAHGTQPDPYGAPPAYGTQPNPYGTQPDPYGAPPPAYGTPPAAYGTPPGYQAPDAPAAAPASELAPYASQPEPGWLPDPTGRHQLRYWTGANWTDSVSDGGATENDPYTG